MDRIATANSAFRYRDSPHISVSVQDGLATVVMGDAKSLNSLTRDFTFTLFHKLVELSHSDQVKVILLHSAAKIFCSGGNIAEIGSFNLKERLRSDHLQYFKHLTTQISKPIIGVVHGVAFGGGFELALLCDIIVCSKDAKFAFKEVNLGLIPGLGGTLVAKTIGRYQTAKLIFTGNQISAQEAHELRIVDKVLETPEEALKYGKGLAEKLAKMSMYALIAAKKAIRIASTESMGVATEAESAIFNPLLELDGSREGVGAFLAKRPADFSGK